MRISLKTTITLILIIVVLTAVGARLFFMATPARKTEVVSPKNVAILLASDLQLAGVDGLKAGLKELGYKEGVNVNYEIFNPKGDRDLTKTMAQAIVAKKPDLIITFSTTAASAVRDADKDAQRPFVFVDVGNFKELGIEDIQHPGGFMTGVAADNVATAPKRMEILKALLPNLRTIGVLVNNKHISYNDIFKTHEDAAKKLGIKVLWYKVNKKEEVSPAMAQIAADKPDTVMTTSEAVISGNSDLIAPVLKKAKIPSIDFNVERGVKSGYMIVYGISRYNVGLQGARVVDKVLKGEKPGEIPVEFASLITFEINATLAKEIGVKIPDSLLFQANKVYNQ